MARVHKDVNLRNPKDYWDYEAVELEWGYGNNKLTYTQKYYVVDIRKEECYEAVRKVGSGKYSVVLEGREVHSDERCIIKVLKPVHKKKIKREIKILQNLCGGPNIVRLLDVVRDPMTKTPSLIFEYIRNTDFKVRCIRIFTLSLAFSPNNYLARFCIRP